MRSFNIRPARPAEVVFAKENGTEELRPYGMDLP